MPRLKAVKKGKSLRVAIVGATGLVGSTLLSILEERNFPISKLFLLASARSAGEFCDFKGASHQVQELEKFNFTQTELCFFCTNNEISSLYVPRALEAGNIVIDKSSSYRYDPEVPLIVPEVNLDVLPSFRHKNLIANPNCAAIPIAVALKPLAEAAGLARINIATYQSVSGSGKNGIQELGDETVHLLNGHDIKPKTYPQQIAFNIIPQIDSFHDNGYTGEEMKIIWELQKLFNDPELPVNPTAVRVPVFYGHSAAVHFETKKKLSVDEAAQILSNAPGVKFMEGKAPYATPAKDAAGKDLVYVGRLREDLSCPKGLNLWVVSDNLRKGAALNAVQIAENLLELL